MTILYPFSLKDWLASHGYTARQLASDLGTTPQRLWRISKRGTCEREFLYAISGYHFANQARLRDLPGAAVNPVTREIV